MNAVTLGRVTSASFARNLESCEPADQLACYADDAEVSVVCGRRGQYLRGAAIGAWVDQMCSNNRTMRVVHEAQHNDELTVIAEFQTVDGDFGVYSSIAQLNDGLIVAQQVVLL